MWQYNNTDELYHYGVIGMKWGIRRRLYNSYQSSLGADKRGLRKLEKSYAQQQRNDMSVKRSKSKIGNSKLFSNIRARRMNRTKRKIDIYKDSIKEDTQIVKNLKQKLDQHSKAETAKTKMKIAKKDYKSARHQALADFDKATRITAGEDKRKTAEDSINRSNKLKEKYRQAKNEYKKIKMKL